MKLFLFLLLFFGITAEGANILALFPLPFFSHTNTFMPVLKELVARGHNVTMVSPYPQKDALTNWTDVVVNIKPFETLLSEAVREFGDLNVYFMVPKFLRFFVDVTEIAYQDEKIQKLIKDDNLNFDLLIAEPLFGQESFVAIGHKLNVPVIGVYPLSLSPWATYSSGNPLLPYVPNFRTTYTDHMTFFQRLDNTLISFIELLCAIYYYFPKQENLMETYMIYPGSSRRPPLRELIKNIGLHLVDYHPSVGYIQPLLPNAIPIGGLSVKTSGNLPSDLKKYMDNSINGIIYLSFGSHMPVSSLGKETLDAILSVFRRLDVNILMKWENDSLSNKPDNVKVRKWFPQPDILAHPKCRLFITHGGIHGLSEAVYHGIPVVGIPFFSDQEFNMRFAEKEGFGYILLKNEVSEDKFELAVRSVLNNHTYKENAVRRSKIFIDRPQTALEEAVYWIEYALRHEDLSHLKAAGVELSFYQLFFLDFVLVLVVFILISFTIICYLCKVIVNSLVKSKPKKNHKKKKN